VILPVRGGLLNLGVERHVGELVRALVVLALDVFDLRGVSKAAEKVLDLVVERLQLRFLDAVGPVDLLHDQLRVEVDLKPIWLPFRDRLEAVDQGLIFGFVVCPDADEAMKSAQPGPLIVLDDDPDGGGPWVAARRAIGAQAQCLQASTRMRLQCSQ
jgi:hypothetical protein